MAAKKKSRKKRKGSKHGRQKRILLSLATRSNYCILECGAGPKLMSQPILTRARKVILVDPVGEFLETYRERFANEENFEVECHQVAISEERGKAVFYAPENPRVGLFGSGHGSLLPRKGDPVLGGKWRELEVDTVPLSEFDPGDIDIAIIDVEGNEMAVLETMLSRPEILCIEANGREADIKAWASREGYRPHRHDGVNLFLMKR